MSTESPPESVSCPNCGDGVIFSGNTPEWCPQCGARLQPIPAVKSLWKNISMALMSCVFFVFGGLAPCALIIYGAWQFAQTTFGALALAVLGVFLVVVHVIVIAWRLLLKP